MHLGSVIVLGSSTNNYFMTDDDRKTDCEKNDKSFYYDACTLDYDKKTFDEIINKNKKFNIKSLVSHLSLGEAYGSSKHKGKDVESSFTDLVAKLGDYLTVVCNDGIEKELDKVKDIFPALSITDAIHVATALKYKCSVLRTTDKDLFDLPSKKVNQLGTYFSMPDFSISRMKN